MTNNQEGVFTQKYVIELTQIELDNLYEVLIKVDNSFLLPLKENLKLNVSGATYET